MISMSCITGGGFIQCMPANCAGRFVAAASAVMLMELVLDARMAWAGTMASSFRKRSFFAPSFSTMASMARSAPAQSSSPRAGRMRPSVSARCASVSFPFSTSFPRVLASFSTDLAASSGVASASVTAIPVCAATWAMPLPIWPAPMTAMCEIAMVRSSRCASCG